MVPVRLPRRHTRQVFLAWEEEQDGRWELLDGVLKMRAGGSVDHNQINGDVFSSLRPIARAKGRRAVQQNQKLAPEGDEAVVYPDVFVTCRSLRGDAQMVGGATVVVEVVPRTSRDDDLRRKVRLYQELPELRHYVVIESLRASVVHFHRIDAASPWEKEILETGGGSLRLGALDASIPLETINDDTDLLP